MCAIAGFTNIKIDKSKLNTMLSLMGHRGPDDQGVWIDENLKCGLGHRRLSIIDLSSNGHQPMESEDGKFCIVFNGEIYNYKKLRTELESHGFCFKSSSDTEVLLKAFHFWGEGMLPKLNGMFSFAIINSETGKLFLARDRFGEKPLYFYLGSDNEFLFASEIRALIGSHAFRVSLNRDILPEFLSYQTVHYPNTLIKNISVVEPGHCITVDKNSFSKHVYWKPEIGYEVEPISTDLTLASVKELFIESVKSTMVSDVPVGAFLSGGIDSTILTGVAAMLNPSINTYTVCFNDSTSSDGYYSRIAAKKFNTNHCEITLSADDVLHQVQESQRAVDHPSADGVNTYILSKAVRKIGTKVALSGLGGDEIFGGYNSFRQLTTLSRYKNLTQFSPRIFREMITATLRNNRYSIGVQKIGAFISSSSMQYNYLTTRRYFFDHQIDDLLSDSKINMVEEHPQIDFDQLNYSKISAWELQFYMCDVLLRDTDQMSMANSLEVRSPFLDHRLVQQVLRLPDFIKRERGINKSLFVNALSEFIPNELKIRKKQGFTLPFDRWMRSELKSYCEERMSYLKKTGLFKSIALDQYWHMYLSNAKSINWARIWLLVSFSQWLETNSIKID